MTMTAASGTARAISKYDRKSELIADGSASRSDNLCFDSEPRHAPGSLKTPRCVTIPAAPSLLTARSPLANYLAGGSGRNWKWTALEFHGFPSAIVKHARTCYHENRTN